MGFEFTLETSDAVLVQAVDEELIDGEDISMFANQSGETGGMHVTPAGDLATVTRVPLARQSVIRELPQPRGSFPRRPGWGGGMNALMFRGATPATRDQMESQARACLEANPRLRQVHEVLTSVETDGDEDVLRLRVRADATSGGLLDAEFVVQPPGFR